MENKKRRRSLRNIRRSSSNFDVPSDLFKQDEKENAVFGSLWVEDGEKKKYLTNNYILLEIDTNPSNNYIVQYNTDKPNLVDKSKDISSSEFFFSLSLIFLNQNYL